MNSFLTRFDTNSNWETVYNEERRAQQLSSLSWVSLPSFDLGVRLSSPIISVEVYSSSAKSHWVFAGRLYQKIQLGAGGTVSALPKATVTSRKLNLDRATLLFFPQFSNPPDYELSFTPAHWLKNVQLIIRAYRGEFVTEDLNLLRQVHTQMFSP